MVSGKITDVGWTSTAGQYLEVEGDDGWTYRYCHLMVYLKIAGTVEEGTRIARAGETGAPDQRHLHVEKYTKNPNLVGGSQFVTDAAGNYFISADYGGTANALATPVPITVIIDSLGYIP